MLNGIHTDASSAFVYVSDDQVFESLREIMDKFFLHSQTIGTGDGRCVDTGITVDPANRRIVVDTGIYKYSFDCLSGMMMKVSVDTFSEEIVSCYVLDEGSNLSTMTELMRAIFDTYFDVASKYGG